MEQHDERKEDVEKLEEVYNARRPMVQVKISLIQRPQSSYSRHLSLMDRQIVLAASYSSHAEHLMHQSLEALPLILR